MANLKLKVKKSTLVRNINGTKKPGYYGRVITNGTKTYEEIAAEACVNTTVHKAEMKVASELLLDAITAQIKQGFIIDLGPLGKLYPAVNGTWKENADDLSLSDLKPKVNYKPSADIEAAVRGAQLSWTTEAETPDTAAPADDDQTGGTTTPPSGDLEG